MSMKQIPLAIRPEAAPTFDNFIVGNNAQTLSHLSGLRSLPEGTPQPLYLWGPSGVGKTHLLRALANEWEQATGTGVLGLDLATLAPRALRDAMQQPGWRLLVLDACDGYDADQQQAAFALFVEASTRGAAIAAAGRLPPVDLALRDDLRTRLGWGLVLTVEPLSEDQLSSALHSEADRRGLALTDEVVTYLLTRFPRDLKHLMELFDRLDDFALSRKRALTVPLLKQMLAESPPETPTP